MQDNVRGGVWIRLLEQVGSLTGVVVDYTLLYHSVVDGTSIFTVRYLLLTQEDCILMARQLTRILFTVSLLLL